MGAADVASAYYADQGALSRHAVNLLMRKWGGIDPDDISRSWQAALPDATAIATAAQGVAAQMADPYLSAVVPGSASGYAVDPAAFAGVTQSGETLDALFSIPIVDAKQAIAAGTAPDVALKRAGSQLAMYAQTLIADAGRLSVAAGMGARPHVQGYYRMLSPPSCSRCAILAGKFFRYNQGFSRHPRCFPAGVAVSGPAALAATRRWYEGELVVLSTASGQNLSLTGNHPVLTRRGWVPANLLDEGDEVVRSTRPEGATPLVVPNHHQVPALVEDVWRSFGMRGLQRVPSTAEDFHGDGQHGEVDVVFADRTLPREVDGPLGEQFAKVDLAVRGGQAALLDLERMPVLVDLRRAAKSRGDVGGSGLALALLGRHLRGTQQSSIARSAAFDAAFRESLLDYGPAHAVLARESILARTSEVGRGDFVHGQVESLPRWDAPGHPFSVESREAYARTGLDLLHRLTGQVELDRVVELRRVEFSGHVYSLTSVEGWHTANSLIVSNCDCRHIPVAEADDSLAFDARKAIEAGQVTGLSQAELTAILDYGADPSQVVNIHAKGSLYTADGMKYARAGTSLRSVAGARLAARDIARATGRQVEGRLFTNFTIDRAKVAQYQRALARGRTFTRVTKTGKTQSYAYRTAGTRRLTPEQILANAKSRGEAIRELVNHGYILDLRDTAAALRRSVDIGARSYADRIRDALHGEAALRYAQVSLTRAAFRLPYDDVSFLRQYKGTAYVNINDALRRERGNLPDTFGFAFHREATGILDRLMARSATRAEVVTYRGIADGHAVFGAAWGRSLVGGEWTEHAYLSTSVSERVALDMFHQPGGAVIRLLVPKGVGAIELSGMDYEAELLLQRGLRMRVVADSGPGTHPRRIDIEVLR